MLYSDYSVEQLQVEIGIMQQKLQKAEQMGNISEFAVYERKIQVARSYMLNPEEYLKGESYQLHTDPSYHFQIDYINGVFAWGNRMDLKNDAVGALEAVPISILGKNINKNKQQGS